MGILTVIRRLSIRNISAALVALAAPTLSAAGRPLAAETLEYSVKAAYLYKFAPFVQWPQSAGAGEPFTLCVVGDDPFDGQLDRSVAGQRIGPRPVVVKRYKVADGSAKCDVMFIGGSREQPVAAALEAVRGKPVLTVTDVPPNAPAHGIVNFVIDDNHVRFDIDEDAANANGVAISAKLLSLAHNVIARN